MELNEQELKEAQEIVEGLDVNDEKKKVYSEDKDMLGVLFHQVKQKRTANAEAKAAREKNEAKEKEEETLEAKRKAKEEEGLRKKGEFEKLYKEKETELESEKKSKRDLLVRKEIEILAVENGIRKREYIKLFDTDNLKIDENGNIIGIEEKFKEFKEKNADLFGEKKVPKIDVDKTKAGGEAHLLSDKELERLEQEAKTGNTNAVARYQNALKKRKDEANKK